MIDSIAQNNRPYLIGIAGGSGSGKTYFARELAEYLGDEYCELIFQDNFYIDQSSRFDYDGGAVNFDHPESIDFDLLCEKLQELKNGQGTNLPCYDFVTHTRTSQTVHAKPKRIILIDGILIFHPPALRDLIDHRVFFDTPETIRYSRRLERDVKQRGRDADGVNQQFYKQVKPMHDQFVEPTKKYAHKIINEMSDYNEVLNKYKKKFDQVFQQQN